MGTYYIVKMDALQQTELEGKLADFQKLLFNNADFNSHKLTWEAMSDDNKQKIMLWFYNKNLDSELNIDDITVPPEFIEVLTSIKKTNLNGGSRRRRRPSSRKYKKSAKRVFRKKSRSTRRR
jgi:hypothetical protein